MQNLKITMVVFVAIFAAVPLFAHAGEMDLFLRSLAAKGDSRASWSKSLPEEGGVRLVPCILKVRDAGVAKAEIERCGGTVGTSTAHILSAKIPVDCLNSIASVENVIAAEFAAPLSKKMDTARAAASVDVVQNGEALGSAYDGKNVIIGIIDDALDYGHPDFGGSSASTRIQYLRQIVGDSTLECTKKTIANSSCTIEDQGQGYTHGTHVTGIAAGGDSTYTGVAPQADIMFSFLNIEDANSSSELPTSFATNVLDGVSTIFQKADIMDKAAVVNLSLGTSIGAHDGTSLFEQGLTELSGDLPGRIIVGAAGNEQVVPEEFSEARRDHVGGIHASIDAQDAASEASRFAVWSGTGAASAFLGGTLVDLWLSPEQANTCSLAVFGYTNGRSSSDFTFPGLSTTDDSLISSGDIPFSDDSSTTVTSSDGTVNVTIEIDSSDIRNVKPHAAILFTAANGNSSSVLERVWFDVVTRASGGSCSGHMWLYYDYTPYHDFLKDVATGAFDVGSGAGAQGYSLADGDSLYTMTIPATAVGVIAAGSWLPEKPIASGESVWTGMNEQTYNQSDISAPGGSGSITNDLSSFSSLGPTADERTKPEIAAPGEPIISAKARGSSVSSSIAVNEYHYKSAGTSMSSPFVTGVIALLLDRNNTLTVTQIKEILASGATADGMTAKTPDPANSYGAGKINAAAILAAVEPDTSAYGGTGDLESPDSGGCALIENVANYRRTVISLSALLLPLALLLFSSRSSRRGVERRRPSGIS